jgi:hypothetical protein
MVAIPDEPMTVEPIELAETSFAASGTHGTLANVSAADGTDRGRAPLDHPSDAALTTAEGPAVRDAESIRARISADEAAADAARDLFAANGVPAIEPDTGFARVARSGEKLHTIRYNAILERAPTDDTAPKLRGGTLFLTPTRLLHVGKKTTEVLLAEIDEMVVALERLVLIRLRDGSDMAVEVDQPRLLRVQIAAAIAAARANAAYAYEPVSRSADSR